MPVVVQNEQVLQFPTDIKIAVLNRNPEKSVLRFDGYDHEFPPDEAVIVDTETAFALFAVDTRTPPGQQVKIHRSKTFGAIGTSNSFYNECLIKYGAANTPQGQAWFENFEFKMVKTQRKINRLDFDKIPVK